MSEALVLTDGFVTEHSIMLVEGEMLDNVLQVHRMGNPIVETRNQAMKILGLTMNHFSSLSTLGQIQDLQVQERIHGVEGMFVILSDVHLDNSTVLEKLMTLLRGFQRMDPLPLFVLMGNFTSTVSHPKTVLGCFEELALLISKNFPRLAEKARFVFVPGPKDPGLGQVLPRPPLPPSFRAPLQQRLRNVSFASNPCRIRYFSKELVFFRHNVVSQLRRSCLWYNKNESTSTQHAVKTILDQGHLCPVSKVPIYWQYDHALRLYPLPDAVILGDRVDQYYENYAECDAINPGPFDSDFSFVVYRPVATDENDTFKSDVEFSQVS